MKLKIIIITAIILFQIFLGVSVLLLSAPASANDTDLTRARQTPARVLEVFPPEGEIDVSINTLIIIKFNSQMNITDTQSAFLTVPTTYGEFTWFDNYEILIFIPNTKLEYGTEYEITITTLAKNSNEQKLEQVYQSRFTTINATEEGKKDNMFDWDFWEPYVTGLGFLVTALVALIGFLIYRKKRTQLRRYIGKLDDLYEKNRRDPYVCEYKLTQLKESLKIKFRRGRMEENHYLIMDKKIDDCLHDIRFRKTLTKPKIVNGVEKEIQDELERHTKQKGRDRKEDSDRELEDESTKKRHKPKIIKEVDEDDY